MSDTPKKQIDLSQYIPASDRNVLNMGLFKNIVNKLFTKADSTQIFGWTGKDLSDNQVYLKEETTERKLNALEPVVYTTVGTEEYVFTFADVLQKLEILGIDTRDFAGIATAKSFNFQLPINIDKFCNFSRYRWVGPLTGLTSTYNADYQNQDYVVMELGSVTNDWTNSNHWVHEADILSAGYDIAKTSVAIRPIISYNNTLEFNSYFKDSKPSLVSIAGSVGYTQRKSAINEYPLFNLYYPDGDFSGKISTIVSFAESNTASIDSVLQKRVIRDVDGEIYITHGLVDTNDGSLYMYRENSNLQLCWTPSIDVTPKYAVDYVNGSYIETSPYADINNEGAWIVPEQLEKNVEHNTKKTLSFSLISSHFAGIMAAQPGFTGNPYGSNNFRTLTTVDYGLGGYIKDFDTNFGIFMSLINQLDFSIPNIFDFAKHKYDQLLTKSKDYVLQNILDFLQTTKAITPNVYGENSIFSQEVFANFKNTLSLSEDAQIFADSTAGLKFSIITTPYIRAFNSVQPALIFDEQINDYVIQHHDGHKTSLSSFTADELKAYTKKYVLRSDGNKLPGIINNIPPARPYKNQLWFDTITNTLKHFNVVSDESVTAELPVLNSFWFDRPNNTLYRGDGLAWVVFTSTSAPWKELQLDVIVDELTLAIENDLYEGVPKTTEPLYIDIPALRSLDAARFDNLMEKEFLSFCYQNNIKAPYDSVDPHNAFTWNYSDAPLIPGLTSASATWQQVYQNYFGTARPDKHPWVLQGYTIEPLWWIGLYGEYPYVGQMWDDIKNDTVPGYPTGFTWTLKLGVDTTTGELLPPVVFSGHPGYTEALYNNAIPGYSNAFTFGDLGANEVLWRASIEYRYDLLNIAFKIRPITTIDSLFGFNNFTVNGYTLNKSINKKTSYKSLVLHGEEFSRTVFPTLDSVVISDNETYTVTILETLGNYSIFSVANSITQLSDGRTDQTYINSGITFNIVLNGFDFAIGDKFIISNTSQLFVPKTTHLVNGISQWLVNFLRYNNIDVKASTVNSILREWDIKLGHRVGSLINTQSIQTKSDYHIIPSENVKVVLKKNLREADYWLDTLDIDVVKTGTGILKGNSFVPINNGVDWEYQINMLNPANQFIKYYEYDLNGAYDTINCSNVYAFGESWKVYREKTQLVEKLTPLRVNSIQEVINIISGFAEYQTEQGWLLNQAEYETNRDVYTDSVIDWDTEIQRFLNAQYIGASVGDGVYINPFKSKLWFKTDRGIVSSFVSSNSHDSFYVPTIYDVNHNPITTDNFRVYRSDAITEIHSDVPVMSVHLFTDSYEHIILLDNFIGIENHANTLYDPFTGVKIPRLFISSDKQREANGQLSFDGYYLKGNEVTPNITNTIDSINSMYDVEKMTMDSSIITAAQALIGYSKKDYLNDLGYTDKSQFSFWRGMLKNKGTIDSLNAFVNNKTFNGEIIIDEYWAYKIAEYGDARKYLFPEIKLQSVDTKEQYTKIQFIEGNETPLLGYVAVDGSEDRWFTIDDQKKNEFYFELENFDNVNIHVSEYVTPSGAITSLYDLPSSDVIEVYNAGNLEVVLIEDTDYIFVNSTTIRFISIKANPNFVVKCFRQSFEKHSPLQLINYKDNITKNIILWDPLRESHNPAGLDAIDIIAVADPAKYNYSLRTIDNANYFPSTPWLSNNVGDVWFNTATQDYIPYNDTSIFPELKDRLSLWGKQAGNGYISINEWVDSPVHPEDYDDLVLATVNEETAYTGTPAFKELYSRERTWENRVVAWKYSPAPGDYMGSIPYSFDVEKNIANIDIDNLFIGPSKIYLDDDTWTNYDVTGKTISFKNSTTLTGEAILGDTIYNIVGSSTSLTTPTFISDTDITNLRVTIPSTSDVYGTVKITEELIGSDYYIRATNTTTNVTQLLILVDTPDITGARVEYNFSSLNLTLSGVINFTHTTSGFTTLTDRLQKQAEVFANAGNDIVIRSAISANNIQEFNLAGLAGWIVYSVPTELLSDLVSPFNKWEPVYGEWSPIRNNAIVYAEIDKQIKNPLLLIDGSTVSKYKFTWSNWTLIEDDIRKVKYDSITYPNFFEAKFTYAVTPLAERTSIYVNGMYKAIHQQFEIVGNSVLPTNTITFNQGDMISVVQKKYTPTAAELLFDETTASAAILTEYKYDYQYSKKDVRDENGNVIKSNYYFWITNNTNIKQNKKISVLGAITSLQNNNSDSYCVVDNLKLATQTLPVRFTQCVITDLNKHVTIDDTYKLRLVQDYTFRDDSKNISLKNIHVEWILINENQTHKLPKKLWDHVTYSIAGQNQIGDNIPALDRVEYDKRYKTKTRFGLGVVVSFVEKEYAKETLLQILLETRASYEYSFIDYDNIESSFNTVENTINILQAMYNELSNKSVAIVNKIFFAILEDALNANYNMSDIFKTSYVSLKYIRKAI